MDRNQATRRFSADNRAVSAVVGFILIFGILVLLLTVYQAQIVPQQNAQTEFEHFEDSQNELIELRNSISTAGQADVSQFPSVNLGENYQTRLLTINPAPPVGTLQTSEQYNITIANETHQTNVSSRFLVYEPGYNELQIGSTAYEHSVLYIDERDRENNVSIVEDQNLVKDGKVRITVLQNSFQQQGTDRITLELYPQDELTDGDGDFPEGDDLNVTIPTQLSDNEYWNDELENEDVYDGVDIDAKEEGIHTLNLSVNETNLEVNTVGIRQEPNEGPAKNTRQQAGGTTGDSSGVTDDDSLSFDGLPTATSSGSGNNVNEIEFEFDVSNPDNENYRVAFGVRNPEGDKSIKGPLRTPSSPRTVDADDGPALPQQINQQNQHLDVEIILENEDGSVVDTRSGRINNRDETITLS